jgi:chemotaxis protein CheD
MQQSHASAPAFDRGVVTTIHQGDCLVGNEEDLTFATILGSCISACIRDTQARVGGMNHFLLAEPSGSARDRYGASARYGAFAMEQLINKVLSRGSGRKGNLEIKIFGGGLINAALTDVGAKNIEFVHEFLSNEGYAIASEDVGGTYARRVMFKPHSGRAFIKRLDSVTASTVAHEELSIVGSRRAAMAAAAAPKPPADDIELF